MIEKESRFCKRKDMRAFHKAAANRMAREVARLIELRRLDPRSAASDALLDYLNIGCGGPDTVPEWCEQYDAAESEHVPAERAESDQVPLHQWLEKMSRVEEFARSIGVPLGDCTSIFVDEMTAAVEVQLDPAAERVAEHIPGEGADICLYRCRSTGKITGIRLPLKHPRVKLSTRGL